jgi:hypothetical protein
MDNQLFSFLKNFTGLPDETIGAIIPKFKFITTPTEALNCISQGYYQYQRYIHHCIGWSFGFGFGF